MRRLFQPIRIGPVELKNRIVFPPVTTGYEDKGAVTRKSIALQGSGSLGSMC